MALQVKLWKTLTRKLFSVVTFRAVPFAVSGSRVGGKAAQHRADFEEHLVWKIWGPFWSRKEPEGFSGIALLFMKGNRFIG